MAVRKVELRLTATGFAAVGAELDKLDLKLDKLKEKFDLLSKKVVTPRVEVTGIDEALAKVATLSAALDVLGRKDVTPRVSVGGGASGAAGAAGTSFSDAEKAIQQDLRNQIRTSGLISQSLGRQSSTDKLLARAEEALKLPSGGGGGNLSMFHQILGGMFGLRGGGGGGGGGLGGAAGGAAGAAGSAGGAGSGILSSLAGASNAYTGAGIAGLLALAASVSPAVIPFGLGGLVGGGAAFGAYSMGSTAHQKILQLQQSLLTAKGPTRAYDLQQIAHLQKNYGPELGLYGQVGKVGHAALGTFNSALTSNAPGTTGTSFISGLDGILKQIGGFVKTIGPELGSMFRASIPFVSAFVKILEQFAKAIMPALTQSMKAFTPYLPQMIHAFAILSQGIASFIKDLGPGMKNATTVFTAVMVGVKGILIGLAYTMDGLAWFFAHFGHNVMTTAHNLRQAWDQVRHDTAVAFDTVRHIIATAYHDIRVVFDALRHDAAAIWDAMWSNTVGRVERGVNDVVKWLVSMRTRGVGVLKALPGDLLRIGEQAMMGLLHGLESAGASVLSYVGNFVSSIPGKFMSLLGIHSPSTVMHEIGLNIGRGLSLGMDHASGSVLTSAARLARGIPMSFGHPYGPSRGHGGGGNGQATLVVTAEGGDLVKAIVKALRYDIKNNGGGNVQNYLGWGSA
jgi:hypothetical protein